CAEASRPQRQMEVTVQAAKVLRDRLREVVLVGDLVVCARLEPTPEHPGDELCGVRLDVRALELGARALDDLAAELPVEGRRRVGGARERHDGGRRQKDGDKERQSSRSSHERASGKRGAVERVFLTWRGGKSPCHVPSAVRDVTGGKGTRGI